MLLLLAFFLTDADDAAALLQVRRFFNRERKILSSIETKDCENHALSFFFVSSRTESLKKVNRAAAGRGQRKKGHTDKLQQGLTRHKKEIG